MSKRILLIAWLALSVMAGSVGCSDDDDDDGGNGGNGGNGSTDNVGACEDWKSAISCEGADLTAINAINCSTYDNTTCDISAYFDCLTDKTSCNGSVLDVSGWTDCQSLATCM